MHGETETETISTQQDTNWCFIKNYKFQRKTDVDSANSSCVKRDVTPVPIVIVPVCVYYQVKPVKHHVLTIEGRKEVNMCRLDTFWDNKLTGVIHFGKFTFFMDFSSRLTYI